MLFRRPYHGGASHAMRSFGTCPYIENVTKKHNMARRKISMKHGLIIGILCNLKFGFLFEAVDSTQIPPIMGRLWERGHW